MAFDTFLDLEGIQGESTAKEMIGKIEIYSFSWGASNPTSVGPGKSGLSAGRVSVSSFNVMKKTDKASAVLFLKCCQGMTIPKATVTLRKAGGDAGQKAFLVYKFTDVMVESIQWSGSSGGDDTPTESLSLAFGKVEIEYTLAGKDGKFTEKGPGATWDLTQVDKGS
jgi:type VI secretion system secreted protein Hcp